ncbi:MAG: hypothetical protein KDK34_13360, partial [Leptospiraceae bacterium]|nr:hypothetical protein [Leptospiraceae bacterium]
SGRRNRSTPAAPGEFQQLLLILAGQKPPFIRVVRTLDFTDQFRVLTYYAVASRQNKDVILGGYRDAVYHSVESIKKALPDMRRQMDALHAECDTPEKFDLLTGRIDHILLKLIIRMDTKDRELLAHLDFINQECRHFILRSVLQQLHREKLVIALPAQRIRDTGVAPLDRTADRLYINDPERLQARLICLGEMFLSHHFSDYFPDSEIGALKKLRADEDNMPAELKRLSAMLLESRSTLDRMSRNHLQVLAEIVLLSDWCVQHQQERSTEAENAAIGAALARIKNKHNIFTVMQKKEFRLPEDIARKIVRSEVEGIAGCILPEPGGGLDVAGLQLTDFDAIYAISLDRGTLQAAIDYAVELFEKRDMDQNLLILERLLGMRGGESTMATNKVPTESLALLRKTLQKVYGRKLPWYVRLLNLILLRKPDTAQIRLIQMKESEQEQKRYEKIKNEVLKSKQLEARAQTISLARERVKLSSKKTTDSERRKKGNGRETRIVNALKEQINGHWNSGLIPTRRAITGKLDMKLAGEAGTVLARLDAGSTQYVDLISLNLDADSIVYATISYLTDNRRSLIERLKSDSGGQKFKLADGGSGSTLTEAQRLRLADLIQDI